MIWLKVVFDMLFVGVVIGLFWGGLSALLQLFGIESNGFGMQVGFLVGAYVTGVLDLLVIIATGDLDW